MWHWKLTPGASAASTISTDAVIDLLDAVNGRNGRRLSAAILQLVRPKLSAEHCAIFTYGPGDAPRLECEASLPGGRSFPLGIGSDYTRGPYRADNAIRFIQSDATGHRSGPAVFNQHKADIEDPVYRRSCYERSGVGDRLSVLIPADPSGPARTTWWVVNLYRSEGARPFCRADADRSRDSLALLASAIQGASERRGPEDADTAAASGNPGLSSREAEVAHLVCQGLSTKEIARRMGIFPSTVTTFRRRIYHKLGIDNGKALAAVWLARNR